MNIPLSCFNAIGTISSIFFIDKLGRRYIILRSTPFVAVFWIVTAIGMSFTGDDRSDSTQTVGGIVACIGVSCFLLSFSFGMSSTPWTLNSEIYPLHVIGTANSLSATTNWLVNAFDDKKNEDFNDICMHVSNQAQMGSRKANWSGKITFLCQIIKQEDF